jgi:glycosyltransferase involved in cell wall biosynthesis
MKISAIVCTHNGRKVLKKALQSLVGQTLYKKDYEILVVDNASTDGSREIIRQFEKEENLHYIFESNLGLSHARNTGWQQSQGDIIAFLDDDAVACPEWLERIIAAFGREPQAGAVGGRVMPIWEAPMPRWVSDKMLRALSVIDWSETPVFLDEQQFLVGANISFPKKLLEKVGGFSSELGRKGKCLLSNEESLLVLKIKESGYKVYYDPQIKVDHLIPANRLSKGWFRKRFYWQGISDSLLENRDNDLSRKEKNILIKQSLRWFKENPVMIFNLFRYSNNKNVWAEKIRSYYRLGCLKGVFSLETLGK